ncbi:MAG TPA: ABC transporter ATP-binding protein [Candidatus Sulfotelmatobacter sp.]|nr:ABC transporter ATP-binding protein [Candidatus Sulfotelmatobacter sp.]
MSQSDTVIAVRNLSKCYSIGQAADDPSKFNPPGMRHAIEYMLRNPLAWWKSRKIEDEQFWALTDASFDVKAGEVVAVIGRNGAGKSTLLKILSRITEPTTGRIEITGRVGSLLEVGTGFHAELTGRENIFLNGAILGMTRAEIKRKFDEIVAFSEVERFLDTPVKRYSSGMYVRLAFSVAAHLEPEILIVDEVLAVGDSAFQKKCLGKMQEVSRNHGRTVLFVSHNMSAVLQLTTRAVVLDKGRVIYNGLTEKAVEKYAGSIGNDSTVFFPVEKSPRKFRGTDAVRFVSFRFDRPTPIFSPDEDFQFVAKIRAHETVPRIRFSMTVFTQEGVPIGTCFGTEQAGVRHGDEIEFEISVPRPRLAHGRYCCGISVGKGDHRVGMIDFDTVLDTLAFEVRREEGDGGTLAEWPRGWGSIILPDLKCRPALEPSFDLKNNIQALPA